MVEEFRDCFAGSEAVDLSQNTKDLTCVSKVLLISVKMIQQKYRALIHVFYTWKVSWSYPAIENHGSEIRRVGKRGLDYTGTEGQQKRNWPYPWLKDCLPRNSLNRWNTYHYKPVTTKSLQKTFKTAWEEYGFWIWNGLSKNKLTLSNPMKLVEADLKGSAYQLSRKPNGSVVLGQCFYGNWQLW